MKVKLTQIKRDADLEGGLRNKVVEGSLMFQNVELGSNIIIIKSPSLEFEGGFRYIRTSKVVKIEHEHDYDIVHTKNGSIYKLEKV